MLDSGHALPADAPAQEVEVFLGEHLQYLGSVLGELFFYLIFEVIELEVVIEFWGLMNQPKVQRDNLTHSSGSLAQKNGAR